MEKLSYEESLNQLEDILEKLEEGNLPLEDHLKLFEESVGLHRHCMEILNKTEKAIELIIKDGKVCERNFDLEV